jgi:O-antigen/teichoic acid export membrane protein
LDEKGYPLTPSHVVVSKRLVAVNSASFALIRFVHIAAFLWAQHYLFQKISPDEFNVFAVIGSLFFLMPVFTLVFTSSTSRYVVGHYAKGQLDGVTTVVSSVMPVLLIVGGLILLSSAVATKYVGTIFVIPQGFERDARLMLILLAITVTADLVLAPFTLGPHVLQKYVLNNAIGLVGEGIKISLMVTLLFQVSPRALWVAVANATADLFCLVARMLISRRMIPHLRFSPGHVKWSLMPMLFSYGLWNSVIALGNYLRDNAATLVLNRFSTSTNVVCFNLGAQMNRQAQQLWEPVRASLSPPLIALHVNGRAGALRQAYCMGGRYALWLVMLVLTPLIILRQEFVLLYAGPDYLQAADVMLLMLIPIPFRMVNVMLPQMAQAKARLRGLAVRTLAVYSSSVLAVLVAVWRYHADSLGAAAVYAAFSVAGEVLLIWPHASTLVGTKVRELVRETIVPGVIPMTLGAVVLILVRNAYHPNNWRELSAAFVMGLVGHLCGVLLAFRADDRKGIAGLLKRKLVRA